MDAPRALSDERNLLLRLRAGEHRAFESLYNTYKHRLIGNLYRVLKDRDTVEELVHDLYLSIWQNRHRLDPDKSIKAYLFQSAANLAKNALRKSANHQRMRKAFMDMANDGYTHIEENIHQQESKDLLEKILGKLPPQRHKVFTLCKLEGKTHKEVSDLLNISEATVNDHITKANIFLRKAKIDHILLLVAYSIIG